MQITDLQHAAGRAAELLKALANPNRLAMLCLLIEREHSVGELARAIGMRDTAISQQLALLRSQGLVTARRDGQTIYYSIASAEAAEVMATLHRLYCGAEDTRDTRLEAKAAG